MSVGKSYPARSPIKHHFFTIAPIAVVIRVVITVIGAAAPPGVGVGAERYAVRIGIATISPGKAGKTNSTSIFTIL